MPNREEKRHCAARGHRRSRARSSRRCRSCRSYAAARIKTEIERDGATKVGSVEVGLFDRRITLLDLKSDRRRRAHRRALGGVGPCLAAGRTAARAHAARRLPLGRPAAGRSGRTAGSASRRSRGRRQLDHGIARHRRASISRVSMPEYDGPYQFQVMVARAHGGAHHAPGRGAQRRSSPCRERATRSAWRRSSSSATSAAASPHWRRAASKPRQRTDRRRCTRSPRSRQPASIWRRVIAALSSDTVAAGRAVGPRPCRQRQRLGFQRRDAHALRHLAGQHQHRDGARGRQGQPLAHPRRGLRAGAAVARPGRPADADRPAVDGAQGREARPRLHGHRRPRQRASCSRPLRTRGRGPGRNRPLRPHRPVPTRPSGTPSTTATPRRSTSRRRRWDRHSWCSPTRACSSAA